MTPSDQLPQGVPEEFNGVLKVGLGHMVQDILSGESVLEHLITSPWGWYVHTKLLGHEPSEKELEKAAVYNFVRNQRTGAFLTAVVEEYFKHVKDGQVVNGRQNALKILRNFNMEDKANKRIGPFKDSLDDLEVTWRSRLRGICFFIDLMVQESDSAMQAIEADIQANFSRRRSSTRTSMIGGGGGRRRSIDDTRLRVQSEAGAGVDAETGMIDYDAQIQGTKKRLNDLKAKLETCEADEKDNTNEEIRAAEKALKEKEKARTDHELDQEKLEAMSKDWWGRLTSCKCKKPTIADLRKQESIRSPKTAHTAKQKSHRRPSFFGTDSMRMSRDISRGVSSTRINSTARKDSADNIGKGFEPKHIPEQNATKTNEEEKTEGFFSNFGLGVGL